MTMRTYRHFECSSGHEGVEKTTENDHPSPGVYEYVTAVGMTAFGEDEMGYATYRCDRCGSSMASLTKKPGP